MSLKEPLWWLDLIKRLPFYDNHMETLEAIQTQNEKGHIIHLSALNEYRCHECFAKIDARRIYDHIQLH